MSAPVQNRKKKKLRSKGRYFVFLCIAAFLSSFWSAAFFSKASRPAYGGITAYEDIAPAAGESIQTVMPDVQPAGGEDSGGTPPAGGNESDAEYAVQAVLGPKRHAVIASGMDARITRLRLESGDKFKKGDVLVEYDCTVDRARLKEMESRQRVTQTQMEAYGKLRAMESASNMELLIAKENNEQNLAMIEQIKGRLKICRQTAPYDGRVMKKMASQYEYVQNGRVLMDIASLEPLRAEFLVPSKWLQWLNVGTSLEIHVGETGRSYGAKIIAVYGEVDPVSQSVQVVAEMEAYHEELLPGMSGQAVFDQRAVNEGMKGGYLGLLFNPGGAGSGN